MDIKIIEKKVLTLPEVESAISELGKRAERSDIQNKVMGFAKKFKKMKEDDAKKLFEELKSLELATLADEHIAQIVDILPKDLADLKAVFAGSKTTLTPENFQKIQDIVAKYRK